MNWFTTKQHTRKILTTKGARDIRVLTSNERGETVFSIACCEVEVTFILPAVTIQDVRQTVEFSGGLPPGS
jgi:hypothetical protein